MSLALVSQPWAQIRALASLWRARWWLTFLAPCPAQEEVGRVQCYTPSRHGPALLQIADPQI